MTEVQVRPAEALCAKLDVATAALEARIAELRKGRRPTKDDEGPTGREIAASVDPSGAGNPLAGATPAEVAAARAALARYAAANERHQEVLVARRDAVRAVIAAHVADTAPGTHGAH